MNNQKSLFDQVSFACSKKTTVAYSTSFSMGIRSLAKRFRNPIYGIYGFVRFADEIVDTFHEFNKPVLMEQFRKDTVDAIENRISLNPILNSFQSVYHQYGIEWELVDCFLKSMEMDLQEQSYDRQGFEKYILGSAEVVGLMCLRVFVEGDNQQYEMLKPYAKSLGAAFQKINFLRDIKADYQGLGRTYFPHLNFNSFDDELKRNIELEIDADFRHAFEGIRRLPKETRFGVYLAYTYYTKLFKKIRKIESNRIMNERIRIPNSKKWVLVMNTYLRHNLNLL